MTTPRPGSPLVGVLQVARGRPDGIARFGDTPRAFLVSLAPLAALQATPSLWLLSQGDAGGAAVNLLAALVALLAPPVLSHTLARTWGRGAEWPRYAVAANWSVWAIALFVVGLGPVLALLAGQRTAVVATLLAELLARYGAVAECLTVVAAVFAELATVLPLVLAEPLPVLPHLAPVLAILGATAGAAILRAVGEAALPIALLITVPAVRPAVAVVDVVAGARIVIVAVPAIIG